ncbi:MAG: CRTAC1 family protein [Acidobacteria bacterium]|nr:CRTAC1 family protein [Acidobacteriota bacterium]
MKRPSTKDGDKREPPLLQIRRKLAREVLPRVVGLFAILVFLVPLLSFRLPLASWRISSSPLSFSLNSTSPAWPVSFVDVASQAGLNQPVIYGGNSDQMRFIIETNGGGVAFLDYDNDGWLDIFILSGTEFQKGRREDATFAQGQAPTNRLYRSNRDGTFTNVTESSGLRSTGWASGVCAGDYDNDGYLDIFITYYGQNVLYRNSGKGRFEDVTRKAQLGPKETRWGSGCTFVDYDRDGRLDLFVANYLIFDRLNTAEPGSKSPNCMWKGIPVSCGPLGMPTETNLLYHNNGDGIFTDVSEKSGIAKVTGSYSMTATAADLDGDGWVDIYVACDSTASIFYRNNGDGTFADAALESGVAYSEDGERQAGMGIAMGDYNNDGLLDLFKTHFADQIPALYRNLGNGRFQDVAMAAGLGSVNRYIEWGAGMPDLDNDGLPDLVYTTGNIYPQVEQYLKQYPHRGPRIVFRNSGNGRFQNVTELSGPGATSPHSSRGAAFGDFDNDGDIDILIMNMNEPPSLLRNEYGGPNGWIKVKLEGSRSNRTGLGATVRVSVGGRTQAQAVLSQSSYYSHDDLQLHFGLGQNRKADRIEVRWPSGHVQVIENVAGQQVVTLTEEAGIKWNPLK